MDRIKELTEKKELLKRLVAKETDEVQIKKIGDEIAEVNEAIIEAKADAKAEKIAETKMKEMEEKAEKDVKEAAALKQLKQADIEVGTPASYKGVNLKRAMNIAGHKNSSFAETRKKDPDLAERIMKNFADMANDAMSRATPLEKAMAETPTTAGGYLTPTDERMEVVSYMRKSSVALQDANVIQMNTDTMTFPKENGQVSVALRGEGSAVSATSPTFTQVTLNTVNFDAYTDASKELVMDSETLIATLMSQFVEAGGQKVDSAVFQGAGSPMSGIFTAAAGYSEVFAAGSSNFSELLSTNLDAIIGKVYATPQDTARLKWYAHPTVIWRYLKTLKNADGDYLYLNSQAGEDALGRLMGYPVKGVYTAASATAASTALAAFGDLSGVYIGERLNTMQLFYDPYTDAANGNDRFFWYTRWAFNFAQNLKIGRVVTAS